MAHKLHPNTQEKKLTEQTVLYIVCEKSTFFLFLKILGNVAGVFCFTLSKFILFT